VPVRGSVCHLTTTVYNERTKVRVGWDFLDSAHPVVIGTQRNPTIRRPLCVGGTLARRLTRTSGSSIWSAVRHAAPAGRSETRE
jgi:hypothetical protein